MTLDPIFIAIVVIGAVLAGLGLGWFLGSRPVGEWKARHGERETEFKQAISELATMSERAGRIDGLTTELTEARNEREALRAELAAIKSETSAREKALEDRYAERERHFERELSRLVEAEEKLQVKFHEIGEKMLQGASAKFLEGAQSRLETLNKQSLAELEKKVGPVGETLERYRRRVEEIEKGRSEAWHQLQGVIGEVKEGQRLVLEGAQNISTTLRGATKARGDWGELQFENLLESCGLITATDFDCQVTVDGETGKLRPDAVINIPGGRRLIVDIKNVFNTYVAANEANSEEERHELLRGHAREIRTQIDDLSAKRYQDFIEGSADFVVMFIPGEHVLYTALSMDPGLLDYALKRQVVLSSPLNFMSIALTVATIWRQAGMQADAEEIAKLGKELYDRLGVVAGHLGALRKSLASTNQNFDKLVGSFDTNLRRTGERFEELSVDTSAKELVEAPPLNTMPRQLVNFSEGKSDGTSNHDSDDGDGAEAAE